MKHQRREIEGSIVCRIMREDKGTMKHQRREIEGSKDCRIMREHKEKEKHHRRDKRDCVKCKKMSEHKGRMKHLSKENRGCTNSCNSHSCTDECISTLYRTRTHHTLLKYLANLRSHVQSPRTAHHQAHFRIL